MLAELQELMSDLAEKKSSGHVVSAEMPKARKQHARLSKKVNGNCF